MTAVRSLTIIVVLILNTKTTNTSADNHSLGAEKKLLNKCCPISHYILEEDNERRNCRNIKKKLNFSKFEVYTDDFYVSGRSFEDVFELNDETFYSEQKFHKALNLIDTAAFNTYLTENGAIYIERPNEVPRWSMVNSSNFCVDYRLKKHGSKKFMPVPRFLAILPNEESSSSESVCTMIGLFTSCVFLALVLVVYSLLPEQRNLNGLVQMAYVACLLTAFLTHAVFQTKIYSLTYCRCFTYLFYFSMLASFCWMNLMSYDIWWTFREIANARLIHRFEKWIKFKVYCAYAFGVPLAMTVFFITVDLAPMRHLPWFVTPNIGKKNSFILGWERMFYLYAPMLIMILINWLFFLMTSFDIWWLHGRSAILDTAAAGARASHRKHRTRMLIYLKLSIIMGVNWFLEVISSFSPNLWIWNVTDAYNFFIGIGIFLIFVCKKRILRKLKRRFCARREPTTSSVINKSHLSRTLSSEASQDLPLRVCLYPDLSCKHGTFEGHYEFI